jgi:proteasome lid subunit RPN8/RPN11
MNDLTATKVETVRIMSGALDRIRKEAEKESDKGGYEAVGILAAEPGGPVGAIMRLNNHAPTPRESFFVEPWEQFQAERKIQEAGLVIVGTYHSHVTGEAHPSEMDKELARPGELMFIHSVPFGDTFAWREKDGELHKVDLESVDPDA